MNDPRVELVLAAEISEQASLQINDLDQKTSWGIEPESRNLVYSGPAKAHVLIWVGKDLATKLEIIERHVLVGNAKVAIAGIGGVATDASHQKKGLATQALNRAIQFIRNDMLVPFALLTCLDHRKGFYAARGWEPVLYPVICDQAGRRLQLNIPGQWVLAYMFGTERPSGPIDLLGFPF